MNRKHKPTVGEQYVKAQKEVKPFMINVNDLQESMTKEYLPTLVERTLAYRKENPGNFYIEVMTKSERLMPGAFRNYYRPRKTCPTPNYDQTVFWYNSQSENIEFIWTVPCRDACVHLIAHSLEVHDSERQLLQFVLDFADGTLFELCKKLNGETAKPGVMLQA